MDVDIDYSTPSFDDGEDENLLFPWSFNQYLSPSSPEKVFPLIEDDSHQKEVSFLPVQYQNGSVSEYPSPVDTSGYTTYEEYLIYEDILPLLNSFEPRKLREFKSKY